MTFTVGKTYKTRSICDSNCWFSIFVIMRTEKTIRVTIGNKEKTLRISIHNGVEQVKPYGSYSMCPIIRAEG